MALGNIVRIRLFGEIAGQQTANIFHYRCSNDTGLPTNATTLADGFAATVVAVIAGVLSSSFAFTQMETQDLDNPSAYDFRVFTPPVQGGIDENAATSFTTVTYINRRPYPPLRHGYKRFAGVPELSINNNTPTASYLALLQGAEGVLGASRGDSAGNVYVPVIRYKAGAGFATRDALNWDFLKIGSQNTRKP